MYGSLLMMRPSTGQRFRYHIQEKLGRGAGATVFLAEKYAQSDDPTAEANARSVAIKVAEIIREKNYLKREARVLAQLDEHPPEHPRVVRVHEGAEILEEYELEHTDEGGVEFVPKHGGRCLIELEYLPGKTLTQWMQEDWFDLEELEELELLEVASRHAHDLLLAIRQLSVGEEQILHRDIKPENLMVTADGLRLFDFNAARTEDRDADLTMAIGTEGYWAPEVRFGPEYDRRADLFSVGVIFWELLHRRRFEDDFTSLRQMGQPGWVIDWPDEEFAGLPEAYGPQLAEFITGLLCEQSERFASADLALEHLERLRAALAAQRAPAPSAPRDDDAAEAMARLDVISTIMELRPNGQAAVVADVAPEQLGAIQRHVRESTRVTDPLETYLQWRTRQSLEGQEGSPRLILLGGNAGDGKSYLIDRLIHELLRPDERARVTYIADATHSLSPTQSQRDRLLEFFAPFADDAPPGPAPEDLHLIAMNTGMVIKFFEEVAELEAAAPLQGLYRELQRQLGLRGSSQSERYEHLVEVINLDLRSMIRPMQNHDQGFFEAMLDRLDPEDRGGLLGEEMLACQECRARSVCPVYFNLHALRRDQAPRAALVRLMSRVELDPEVHLSPRNLWGFIYRLITGGMERYDVPERDEQQPPCEVVRLKYDAQDHAWLLAGHHYVTAFAHEDLGGMWAALARLDPTYAATFQLDQLHTRFSVVKNLDAKAAAYIDPELGGQSGVLAGTQLDKLLGDLPEDYPAELRRDVAVRRHLFFDREAFADYDRDIGALAHDQMLPFEELLQAYRTFSAVGKEHTDQLTPRARQGLSELCKLVQRVIVRSYGRQLQNSTTTLLRVSQPNTRTSSRLFIQAEERYLKRWFNPTELIRPDVHVQAHRDRDRHNLLDIYGYLPDTITLDVQGYRLVVDKRLYDFLHEVALGKQPSALDLAEFQAIRYAGERLGNVLASRQREQPVFYILDGASGNLHTLQRDAFGHPTVQLLEEAPR